MIKHIFIVNPVAGKGVEGKRISDIIKDACDVSRVNYEIYRTTCKSDATVYVKKRLAEKPLGDIYRFYACGGDGTFNEVINGVVHDPRQYSPLPGVQVGVIPIGTGNDFVRNFAQKEFFSDVTKQLLGDPMNIDCYSFNDRFGINMFNVGFDCDVVCKAAELKKKSFMPKALAYMVGVAIVLIRNRGSVIKVVRSDGSELAREFELCAVANGGFCGGGFHSAPKSRQNDGLLDISLISKVSRRQFLSLIGPYKKGTHLNTRLGRRVVNYFQDKSIAFYFDRDTAVSIDGEIELVRKAEFSIVPNSVSFIVPVGVEYPLNFRRRFIRRDGKRRDTN